MDMHVCTCWSTVRSKPHLEPKPRMYGCRSYLSCMSSQLSTVVRQRHRQLADRPGTQREIAALQQVDVLCFAAVVRSNEARICRPCVPGPASAIVGTERKKQPQPWMVTLPCTALMQRYHAGIAYALQMLDSVISHQSSVIIHNLYCSLYTACLASCAPTG